MRSLRAPLALLAAFTLVGGTVPPSHAALDPVASVSGKDGGKKLKFVVGVDGTKAYVVMKIRKGGAFRSVDRAGLDCKYWDGSHDATIELQKADDQVLVSWTGPGGDVYSEYGGYDVGQGEVEAWGAESCPGQG
jgi:hypothetical protein